MIQKRKSAFLFNRASLPVVEAMEDRRLLSATISVGSTLMVFNAVSGSSSQTATLLIANSGDAALNFSSITIANDPSASGQDASKFNVVNASSEPASLAPGGSFGLQLKYTASSVTTNRAVVDITTNDPINPTIGIGLSGIGTAGLGGSNQPSLATILRAYNIPTIVGEGPNDSNAASDSVYPNPPDSTSQEVVLQTLVKAGSGPVTIQTLASFTASGTKPYTLGTYTPGNPNSLSELFFTPSTESQSTYVQPEGATSFDPGSAAFGFYFVSNVQVKGRIGYSEDAFNTWDTTNDRKFRFFPLENANGTAVPNAYIMTSTEYDQPIGYDFTNIVAIVRNVKAAPNAPASPVIGVTNPNPLPGSNTVIFSKIQSPNSTLGDIEHDTAALKVTNTGGGPLIITSYTLNSAWTLESAPTFPVTIAAGSSLTLSVKFTANSHPTVPYNETNSPAYPSGGGVYSGTLVLNSNDPNTPISTTQLEGWWQLHSENSNEPSLQTMVNLLAGYTTNINPTPISELTESSSTSGSSPTYYGEEVVSAYWQEADTGQNVTVTQLATYHTEGAPAVTYYTNSTSSSSTRLLSTANDSGQSMFPITQTSSPAIATFSTTSVFGFRVDAEYSDNSKNSFATGGGHHFRFYPVRTAAGNLVPNTYIMCMDYSNTPQNFDFQDNVYIISNIRPVTVNTVSSPQTTGAPAAPSDFYALATGSGNYLQWGASLASTLTGYNLYRASSSAGPFTLITSSPVSTSTLSYTDSTAPAAGTSYYQVTAVNSAGQESLGATASVINNGSTSGGGAGAPVAAAETRATMAGVALVINEVPDATDNTMGTIVPSSVVISTAAAHGTTSVDATTGAITYTPAAGYTGADTFQYTIADNTGAVSAPATVTITVSATAVGNPVAANLSISATADSATTIPVVASATDTSATLDPSTVTITQQPAHGSAAVDTSTGNIIYTPTSGYIGPDTILYTIGDNLLAVSGVATISLTVKLSGPLVPDSVATTLVNSTTTVNVVQGITDAGATVAAGSVTITTPPIHGTATVNASTGAITYTPGTGYVGADTVQYTVSDSNHTTSDPATLTLNVGVTINSTTAKSLTFVDASGSTVTVTLTGLGSAQIFMNGTGLLQNVAGPHGTGRVVVTGSGLGIASIVATNTAITDSLTIARRGSSVVGIGSISVDGALNRIMASATNLTGALTVSGALGTLQLASATGATLSIGAASARTPFQFTVGAVTNTSLTSAIPIKSIKAASWTNTGSTDSITAPSIASLITTGNFQAALTTSASGTPFSLGTVKVGGQIAADAWNIVGTANSVVVGSVAPGWTGTFTGALNTFTVRSGGFAGTLSAAGINTLSITGDDTGSITAGSIRTAKIAGGLTSGSLKLTNPLAGVTLDLGHLTITGTTVNSTITSAGNIGVITSAGFNTSSIDAGVKTGVTLPASLSDLPVAASIASISVVGKSSTFANSNIGAQTVGALNLGTISTTNEGGSFGIGAGTIKSLAATLDTGGVLRMSSLVLLSTSTINSYLTSKSISLGSFAITPGL